MRLKWSHLQSEVKKKAAKKRKDERKTGGGPCEVPDLTPIEEKIMAIIPTVAIEGIPGGIDTLDESTFRDVAPLSPCTEASQCDSRPPFESTPETQFLEEDAWQPLQIVSLGIGLGPEMDENPTVVSSVSSTPPQPAQQQNEYVDTHRKDTHHKRRRRDPGAEMSTKEVDIIRVVQERLKLETERLHCEQHRLAAEQECMLDIEKRRLEIEQQRLEIELRRDTVSQGHEFQTY
ncbi:PREDICTED: uncharacterized protein LOC106816498 [Priapulus caudatus]|uniref:Uncharacterized protein LOC106816498 n=1 Tax=Priapulus caudatus TaxID=37621 RepID=A0ABM1EWN8_PRICU|nr:PREDICTED: uncharacterized protein LOC106816498 [Priapulus caudatus]